ncbi:MAG: hypothetical protein ACK4RS_02245, partial [Thiothrix sp.]
MPLLIGASSNALADAPQLQEAPPPWAAAASSADVPTEQPSTAEMMLPAAQAEPDTATAATAQAVPAMPAMPATGTSIETWYRNRRAANTAVQPINLMELEAAAEAGDIDAQYRLALQYRSTDNPNPDI